MEMGGTSLSPRRRARRLPYHTKRVSPSSISLVRPIHGTFDAFCTGEKIQTLSQPSLYDTAEAAILRLLILNLNSN
jgi:hypothetical protein